MKPRFKYLEAIVFDPNWVVENYPKHPLKRKEVVYYLGEIPNVIGHCIVITGKDKLLANVHVGDFRTATDDEV